MTQLKPGLIGFCLGLVVVASVASKTLAQSEAKPTAEVQSVLDRITESYGGEALLALQSVETWADRRLAWPGQGQTADFVEFVHDRHHKHFDVQDKTGSVERWIDQNGNVYHNRYVIDDAGGAIIDYFNMTVQRNDERRYYDFFNVDYRSSDLLMAYFLATEPPEIEWLGERIYRGESFDILAFEIIPDSQKIEIYVSRDSGLIKRGVMQREIGNVNLIFDSFESRSGITFASELRVYLGETLVEYASKIHMKFNNDVSSNIMVENGLKQPSPMVDQSEMTADALGNGVYQVGQEDYSLFALHDDAWMVVNGFAGLPDRLAAANSQAESDLPMSHVVLTHHHSEHIDGLDEAITLGATIVISPETEKYLRAERDDFDDLDTLVVGDGDRLGPLRFVLGSTSHASDILFVYAEPSKTLFQDGHYHAVLEQGPSRIQPSAVELHAIVSASGLGVDWLVSGHAKNAENWETFEQGIEQQDPLNKCPSGRAICSDVPPMTIHTG
ncbi:MAG: hypothetical protein AAF265_14090 [Pseudomonadota bacterium]